MNVLMFSTDESIFDERSAFYSRMRDYGALFDRLDVLVVVKNKHEDLVIGENVHVRGVNAQSKILALFAFYKAAASILRQESKSYIITSQEEFSGVVALALKWRYGVPWQAQIHSDIFNHEFQKFSFRNRLRSIVARLTLPYATRIRVVSARIKKSLDDLYIKAPVDVLPIFVDVQIFHDIVAAREYHDRGFDFVFCMVSRLAPEKNIGLALKAFSRVVKEYPQTTLRIIGDGSERKRLEEISRSFLLGAHVQFEGYAQVAGYLKSADCFVSTSWYEGYGMSIVEAMAAGLPVITTDVGVAGELLKNNESGLVVPPGDEGALTECMMRLRSDEALRERLGGAALRAVIGLGSYENYLHEFYKSLSLCLPEKK